MNTFLPSGDFSICAKVLDPNRLGNQILEGYWLGKRLIGEETPLWTVSSNPRCSWLWTSSDGVIWLGTLYRYIQALDAEWFTIHGKHHQSYRDSRWMRDKFDGDLRWPPLVHESMMGWLIRKDPSFYRPRAEIYGLEYFEPQRGEGTGPAYMRPLSTGHHVMLFKQEEIRRIISEAL